METNRADKREKIIALTEKGRIYTEEVLAPLFQIEEAIVKDMGEQRMKQLIDSLTAFGDIVELKMEKADRKY